MFQVVIGAIEREEHKLLERLLFDVACLVGVLYQRGQPLILLRFQAKEFFFHLGFYRRYLAPDWPKSWAVTQDLLGEGCHRPFTVKMIAHF